MTETMHLRLVRRWASAAAVLAAAMAPSAAQQPSFPGANAAPPGAAQRNPVCLQLEGRLAALERGTIDPARAEQIRRYEDAANRQQAELDRVSAQARRLGCEGRGFFSLFGGQPPQCARLNRQIQEMRGNLDRVLSDLQRLQGNTADREGERRTILASLGQNDCGPQYRQFVNRSGGFFDSLFGGFNTNNSAGLPQQEASGTFRTICVRTCDGYYFPVSYSTVPSKFAEDEQVCRRMCPAAEVALYSYRNPGETVAQAVSQTGHTYAELPTAFAYRKALNPQCSCKPAGQTWAEALKNLDDTSIERGDIIVDENQAKKLSRPLDSRGRPLTPKPTTVTNPAPASSATQQDGKRHVRIIGPAFYPVR